MYSSNAQPTGTNRPRACPTLTQQDTQTHMCHDDGETALRTRVRVHTQITHRFDHHTPPPARGGTHPGVVVSRQSYGGHSERETPGPIPNPEVKPFSADGTATARSWESRTPPDILCSSPASSEAGLLAFHPQHPRLRAPLVVPAPGLSPLVMHRSALRSIGPQAAEAVYCCQPAVGTVPPGGGADGT